MSEIANLITHAQQMGVKIYTENAQIKLDMPWPIDSIPDPVRCLLRELKGRQAEVLVYLDPDQQRYWEALLTNTRHLRAPKDGSFVPMTDLHQALSKLREYGAYLTKGKRSLKLEQGQIPWPEWNKYLADMSPMSEQLNWVLKLSLLGAAREYVDLAAECPKEWIDKIMGKHSARIAELRAGLMGKERCFELPDGRRYYLVPCKTGQQRTEITPEECTIIAEAQDCRMLPPGPGGAWLWIKETGGQQAS